MIEKIRKIYLNKALLIVSSVLTIICYLADAIKQTVNGDTCYYAWIFLALVILLFWSFFAGQINVQKMLFGAMLLAMIWENVELMFLNASYNNGQVLVIDIVIIVCAAIIFISHLYQQMDHKGKSFAGQINQLVGFIAVIFLISGVINIINYPSFETVFYYAFVFGYVFNSIMIICMETRVETYKRIRDKARDEGTWTEENRQEAKKLFKL